MKRILLIDDEKDFRDGMKVLLEIYGYEVRIAENGSAGYCLRAETNFDLIITDILMPEMDGLELILKVRSVSPNAKIIAISGGGKGLNATDYLKLSVSLGADRALRKPFQMLELLDTIKELLPN
ncbi:MAG: response regulator [Bacteroidota bacterium]